MKQILGIVLPFTLFPAKALAQQDALCYMEWHGQVIDLSSTICQTQKVNNDDGTKPDLLTMADLRFYGLAVEPSSDGTSWRVRGVVINNSRKRGSLSLVKFNIINGHDGHLVTSGAAALETGPGLEPGQQLAFTTTISKNQLGGETKVSDLQVQMTERL